MNSKIIIVVLLGVVLTSALYSSSWMGDYESQTAQKKREYLWKKIIADNNVPADEPGILVSGRLVAPGWLGGYSFDSTGHKSTDEFPNEKSKAIHAVGKVAFCKFEWNKNAKKYTGGFQKADHVLVRFSSAVAPKAPESTPGLSLKFLRDGKPSGNTPAMLSLTGQQSLNFFDACHSNHIDAPPSEISMPQKILLNKFKGFDANPGLVGLSDIAKYTQGGVYAAKIVAPMAFVFQANPALQKKCAGVALDGNNFGCLSDLEIGTKLFKVFAVDHPYSPKELESMHKAKKSFMKDIGYMTLDSKMVSSKFADQNVFYKHVYWKDDVLALSKQKEWASATQPDYENSAGCSRYNKYLPAWSSRRLNKVKTSIIKNRRLRLEN